MYRILVLNDSRVILQGVRSLLDSSGYQVLCTTSSNVALSTLREGAIDLLIQDILRPDINGFSLYWMMKSEDNLCRIPILIFSNWSAVEVTELEQEDVSKGNLYKVAFQGVAAGYLKTISNAEDANVLYVEGYLHSSEGINLPKVIEAILHGSSEATPM